MKLSIYKYKWFVLYKGFIYGSVKDSIHSKINSKVRIDRVLGGFDRLRKLDFKYKYYENTNR